MSQIKQFDTYTLESDLLKVGDFIDSKGDKVSLTQELLEEIYDSIKDSALGKSVHNNGDKIGEIKKLVLDKGVIRQKTLITNVDLFNKQRNNGFNYISPELQVERVNDRVVGATFDGYALSNNPAMIKTPYTVSLHHFDSNESSEGSVSGNVTTPPVENPTNNSWREPLSVLSKKIDTITESISQLGEKQMNITSPNSTPQNFQQPSSTQSITLTPEQLTELIKNAVSEATKSTTPVVNDTKPVETTSDNESDSNVKSNDRTNENEGIPKEILEKLNKITADHEKLLKKQRDERFADLKKLGVTDPKTLIPDSEISLETQIAMLDKFKETLSSKSSIASPLSDPLASEGNGQSSSNGHLHIDNIIKVRGYAPNDELRRELLSTGLFDDNGIFKGD